jgi:hypothetical protein
VKEEVKKEKKEVNSIYKKMLLATEKIGKVAKNLNVDMGKNSYKAVGEKDVLEAVKPIEIELGIYSYPISRTITETNVLTTVKEYNGNKTESNQLMMRIETIYRFVNVDNPNEFIDITTYGDGVDSQDKAPGKAMTYADKYALLKAYKIETGDDPDKEASGELKSFKTGDKKASLATADQIEKIKSKLDEENIKKALELVKKAKLEELTLLEASSLLKNIGGTE